MTKLFGKNEYYYYYLLSNPIASARFAAAGNAVLG